jgi:hypothetical protein
MKCALVIAIPALILVTGRHFSPSAVALLILLLAASVVVYLVFIWPNLKR